MRNSFSLSVCFPLVLRFNVKIVTKTFTASGKMKLIPLTILAISLTMDAAPEHHFFQPQYQTPSPGAFPSESALYLPPASLTPLPYLSIKNVNKLPYPYLPPSGTKTPVGFPTIIPHMVSSTSVPFFENDDDGDDDDKNKRTLPAPQFLKNTSNPTDKRQNIQQAERREMRPTIRNQNYQQPIDRIDMKVPHQFTINNVPNTPNPVSQRPSPRSMIISAETNNDQGIDQANSANYQISHYLPPPSVFISSTTETAVPILRLSNEMDLDGSFSYEALGADQTHYVQHSRMENLGTDKQEQVVEGSYSYVGDNGQTYTVHYVADSNGFRASGDHLPVAPPVPEIIQRSVQYNLAEEARKPPHPKTWNEERENELNEGEKSLYFTFSPPQNLFTGRNPESFSYSFSQEPDYNLNNFATAASSQAPVKVNAEFTPDQTKAKAGVTISPQITFLASQGAYVPSMNSAQPSIARKFSTEKSTMPQLINYESGIKEFNQGNNKGLWKWQYGINPDLNQSSEKNTISRSFSEGDDVMINFNDMTPEQYTNMIRSQLEPNSKEKIETSKSNNSLYALSNTNDEQQYQRNIQEAEHYVMNEQKELTLSTQSTIASTPSEYEHKTSFITNNTQNVQNIALYAKPLENKDTRANSYSKIIIQSEFIPQSQTVTQSYDYENSFYEPRRIKDIHEENASDYSNLNVIPLNKNNKNSDNYWFNKNNIQSVPKITQEPVMSRTIKTIKFSDFIVNDNKNDFKPLVNAQTEHGHEAEITTETVIEEVLKDNIFLKNLFKSDKNEPIKLDQLPDDNFSPSKQSKPEKHPKFFQTQSKLPNEMTVFKNHPTDISEILNYISSRNNFESNKIKPINKLSLNHFNPRDEMMFIPVHQDRNEEILNDKSVQNNRNNNIQNHVQSEELRGIIKNYKILQRNNNVINKERNIDQMRRDLSPPPVRMLQSKNTPPLGRAGPSMKSYLPPIYV